ncbi:FkbM family methyltransferase [Trichocoleus desertorum AS-A10]|uniref:FkbM family methyltransferase n=1 Tax=Trichocoleus desertorum TaxID=1481672 RepID=UPI003297E8E9
MILARLFKDQITGFYVDVGAHHPQRFSNTYYFYLQGWRGINIDAMPGSMDLFKMLRPQDINIEVAISDISQFSTYYIFNEPALNTFSETLANEYSTIQEYEILETRQIKTEKLSSLLEKYLEPNQEIDFMSIDVEGLDYKVLSSNDWARFKPKAIVVEALSESLSKPDEQRISTLLSQNGYTLKSTLINSMIFTRKD